VRGSVVDGSPAEAAPAVAGAEVDDTAVVAVVPDVVGVDVAGAEVDVVGGEVAVVGAGAFELPEWWVWCDPVLLSGSMYC